MPDQFYSSNPNDWNKLEGLYVNEVPPPAFIAGADLSIVGFVGKCVRGRADKPVAITSQARFVEVFGGRDITANGALEGEVWKALQAAPFGQIMVRRVAAAAAVKASANAPDATPTNIIKIEATGPGTWGNGVTWAVEAASSGVATAFNLRITWRGTEWLYQDLSVNSTDNNLALVIGDDDANPVVVTKLASGRPVNGSGSLASGTDGTLATTDYNTAYADMASARGVSLVLIPESLEDTVAAAAQATMNGNVVTLANANNTRLFLTWSGKVGNTKAQETSAVGAQITTRSDRIVFCVNAFKFADPVTGANIWAGPHILAASILSQSDVNVHLGASFNERLAARARELQFESFDDAGVELAALRAAGASTLERRDTGGLGFHSGVTTRLTSGRTEIARRRSVDFLIASAVVRLKEYLRIENTPANRTRMLGELHAFSRELQAAGRVIEKYAIDSDSVNTDASRARGQENVLWRVKLIGHMLAIVLSVEAGTGVVITEQP